MAASKATTPVSTLSWQQQDQLGGTTLLRSYIPGGDEWSLESEISLAYDFAIADSIWWTLGNGQTADRLAQVYRRDGGARRWQQTTSIDYDFLGRKTGLSDADLGNWSYAYNTLGQLTRQTDPPRPDQLPLLRQPRPYARPRAAHGRELRRDDGGRRPLVSGQVRAGCGGETGLQAHRFVC